jgi:hypothetical protein
MDLAVESSQYRLPHKHPAWPDMLAWILCGIALLHAGLLHTITDPSLPTALPIQLLYPLGMVGAAIILICAAFLHSSRSKRWAWILQTCSLLCGLIRTSLTLAALHGYIDSSVVAATSDTLYLLMYVFALSGVALYLPWRVWWLGTTPRVLIDSALVSVATLVLLHSVLPVFIQPWTLGRSHALLIPAFNLAAVFAVGTVSLRYGRAGGPLLAFALASLLCLLSGDALTTIVQLLPELQPGYFTVAPL